jgi:hypothetical protein
MGGWRSRSIKTALLLGAFAAAVQAHEHHDEAALDPAKCATTFLKAARRRRRSAAWPIEEAEMVLYLFWQFSSQLKPIDTVLWLHIYIQIIVWGLIFPVGMVGSASATSATLFLTRSRTGLWPHKVSLAWSVLRPAWNSCTLSDADDLPHRPQYRRK